MIILKLIIKFMQNFLLQVLLKEISDFNLKLLFIMCSEAPFAYY